MKSINFELLRDKWPELASLGGFAENYSHTDPSSSLVKLRAFIESMVERIYQYGELPRPYQSSLNDLLNNHAFKAAVPPVIANALHIIRKTGNRAAHAGNVSQTDALTLLKDAYDLSKWFYIITGGSPEACNAYQEPVNPELQSYSAASSAKNKRRTFEELAAKEAEMKALLDELEA